MRTVFRKKSVVIATSSSSSGIGGIAKVFREQNSAFERLWTERELRLLSAGKFVGADANYSAQTSEYVANELIAQDAAPGRCGSCVTGIDTIRDVTWTNEFAFA